MHADPMHTHPAGARLDGIHFVPKQGDDGCGVAAVGAFLCRNGTFEIPLGLDVWLASAVRTLPGASSIGCTAQGTKASLTSLCTLLHAAGHIPSVFVHTLSAAHMQPQLQLLCSILCQKPWAGAVILVGRHYLAATKEGEDLWSVTDPDLHQVRQTAVITILLHATCTALCRCCTKCSHLCS
jgi:hypothetical protein